MDIDQLIAKKKYENQDCIAILLISTLTTSTEQLKNQMKLNQILTSKKLDFKTIDAGKPANIETRKELHTISGKVEFPQIFFEMNGIYTFKGNYDTIIEMVEMEDFDSEFSCCRKVE